MPLVSPLPLPQANGRARSVPLHPLAYLDVHSSAAVPAPCNTRAVANLVLGSFALLGVLTALFWKLISPSGFPFLLVLTIGLSFQFALLVLPRPLALA